MHRRASQGTVAERITLIQLELMDGKTRKDLLYLCDEWGIQARQFDTYIAQASDGLKEINKLDQEDNLALVHANLWELFRKAKGIGDIRECHQILNSIAKLKGLHEVKITKTIISKFDGIPDDEFDEIFDEEIGNH